MPKIIVVFSDGTGQEGGKGKMQMAHDPGLRIYLKHRVGIAEDAPEYHPWILDLEPETEPPIPSMCVALVSAGRRQFDS